MSSQITGAPLEVIVKDRKYIFYPLRDCDFGEFEIWAQDRYLAVTKRNVKDLPEAQQTLLLMSAFERASLMTFSSKEVGELMKSIEGAAKLIYLSMRKAITPEEAKELATDPEFLTVAFGKIQQLSGTGRPVSKTEKVNSKKKST